ncbi:MAG: MFS transporter [Pseudomonadota bacterium]
MTHLPINLRRNWWLHVLEGTALIGSAAAINPNTVGSNLVERLGGSASAIALMPMASSLGYSIGPILTAHWLDRKADFVPVLRSALPASRLPLLLTALTLWLAGTSRLSLWMVVGGSVAYGVIGGLSIGAWQQLVAKTTPPAERPSLFAHRYLFSNLLGLVMGWLVIAVLSHLPGTNGYALLYLVAFFGASISYQLITRVSEPRGDPHTGIERSFLQNLRGLPQVFSADRRLQLYLLTAILVNAHLMFIGFLGGHARTVLGVGESYLGTLTSSQMAGAAVGTFFVSRLGNRLGPRALLLTSRALFMLVAMGALVATHDYAFRLLFGLYGMAFFVNLVGHNTITLALMPQGRSSSVLAVFSLALVPSMLASGELGAFLWQRGGMGYVAGTAAIALFAALLATWPIQLQRGVAGAPLTRST